MVYILLDTMEKVKQFTGITNNFGGNVFLMRGPYVVDGKSLMGIFSLDLSKVCEVRYEGNDSELFFSAIKNFEI